jgi:hypothetical protein
VPGTSRKRETLVDDGVKPRKKRKHIDYFKIRTDNRLTPELIDNIQRKLARCISLGTILNGALIPHNTFATWTKKGQDYLTNNGPKEHEIYGSLVLAVQYGLGKRDARIEKEIAEKGNPDHRQYLTIGERLIPQVWSRDQRPSSDENLNPDDRFL